MHFADDIIILKCANERVSIADTLVTCSHKVLLQLGVSRQHNRDATKQNIENQGKSGTNGLVACYQNHRLATERRIWMSVALVQSNWTDRCMIECRKFAYKVALLDDFGELNVSLRGILDVAGWGDVVTVHGSGNVTQHDILAP